MSKKLKKSNDIDILYPLTSISTHIFNSESPYRGVWINFGLIDNELEIADHFAENPKEELEKLKIFVDNDIMKNKVIQAKGSEERVTVETWLDLSNRVDVLEQDMNTVKPEVQTLKNTAITNVDDFKKTEFWEGVPDSDTGKRELVIPSNGAIRLESSQSAHSRLEDVFIGEVSGFNMVRSPITITAVVSDRNYNVNPTLQHRIQNGEIRTAGRFKHVVYGTSTDVVTDIWSIGNDILTYPIAENGRFTNLHVDTNIYLDQPTSLIKRKKATAIKKEENKNE